MHEERLSHIRQLHGRMHQHDTPPQNAGERQAEFVINSVRETIVGLVMQGVTPRTLDIALFYHWLRLTTLRRGMTDARFQALASDMEAVMGPLVSRLQEMAPALSDSGPTGEMREIGILVQHVKDWFAAAARELSRAEIERHADMTNRAAFGLVTEFLNNDISPVLVENAFLYFWLRASTLNANVAETFFQKLERNWDEVVKRVTPFMDDLLHR